MMRRYAMVFVIMSGALWVGCDERYDPNAQTPTGPSAPPQTAVVIRVVGVNGAQSFLPNPASIPSGQAIIWQNVDSVSHRIVLDGRTENTGTLRSGALSEPIMPQGARSYHCSIHPSMVGTLR